jgi:hypothetical protein
MTSFTLQIAVPLLLWLAAPPSSNSTEAAQTEVPDVAAADDMRPREVGSYQFETAAHFPLRGFGLGGDWVDHEGLVIFEGMELRFTADARYQVRMRVSNPDVPVLLRLQLVVVDGRGDSHVLNLEPIQIDPLRDGYRVREVAQSGPSSIGLKIENLVAPVREVHRSGTARFGYRSTLVNGWPGPVAPHRSRM